MGYRLGVDLGTTWTAAAVFDGRQPTMVGLGNRALQVPSVVFVGSGGEIMVGEAAERRALVEPDRVAREFKRRIADPVPIYIKGEPFSPRQLTAELLKWVVARTTERTGAAPAEVTLTYPAGWGEYRRSLLEEVCSLAGIDGLPVTYRSEPEAAAAQYVFRTATPAQGSLLVYDLGGGTFDVCVLSATDGRYTVVGRPAGLDDVGGIDFDEMIFRAVIQHCDLEGLDSAGPDTDAALNRLRRECTDAKEALSADGDVIIPVNLPGLSTGFRLLRQEFEDMIRPAILQTVAHTQKALEVSGLGPADLTAVVLVGGSSRIPLVSELLSRELGVPVAVDTHPKHDVALGAALPPGGQEALGPPLSPVRAPVDARLPVPAGLGPSDLAPARGPRRTFPPTTRNTRRLLVAVLVVGLGVASLVVRSHITHDEQLGAPSTGNLSAASPVVPTAGRTLVPQSAAPLSDSTMIWPRVRNGVWGIGSMSLSGKQTIVAQDPSRGSTIPVLSPDRRSVIYLRDSAGRRSLRIVAADGSDDRLLLGSLPGCRRIQAPAWSSGGLLALPCQKSSGTGSVLQLVTLDGHVERILDSGLLGDPTFSRDGRTIVYWRNDDGTGDGGALFRISADGGDRQRLTQGGDGVDNDPVISPDGRTIAYRTRRDGHQVIATVALPGSPASDGLQKPDVLSRGHTDEQEPSWSPDGTQIAFIRGLKDAREVYVMNANGEGRHPLTHDHEADTAPAWSAR
jgi:molecular chaperone DnaK